MVRIDNSLNFRKSYIIEFNEVIEVNASLVQELH